MLVLYPLQYELCCKSQSEFPQCKDDKIPTVTAWTTTPDVAYCGVLMDKTYMAKRNLTVCGLAKCDSLCQGYEVKVGECSQIPGGGVKFQVRQIRLYFYSNYVVLQYHDTVNSLNLVSQNVGEFAPEIYWHSFNLAKCSQVFMYI